LKKTDEESLKAAIEAKFNATKKRRKL